MSQSSISILVIDKTNLVVLFVSVATGHSVFLPVWLRLRRLDWALPKLGDRPPDNLRRRAAAAGVAIVADPEPLFRRGGCPA